MMRSFLPCDSDFNSGERLFCMVHTPDTDAPRLDDFWVGAGRKRRSHAVGLLFCSFSVIFCNRAGDCRRPSNPVLPVSAP